MSKLSIFFTGLLFMCYTGVNAQESKILGTWLSEEGTSHIRVFKATNGKYYGKIVWLRDEPDKLDINNPDESKRSVPLLDLVILKAFTFDQEKKQWNNGSIYDPKNGKTYSCFMWFGDSNDLLFIKGYILGMKFIGRETQWKRVVE
jgi:uncharacterized protein (DUF2147 family)